MARSNRKMRLTEAHVALLPAKIDDPGPMRLDSEGPRPDSYYSATTAALIDAVPPERRDVALRLWLADLEQALHLR